jgi:hypothetical protein
MKWLTLSRLITLFIIIIGVLIAPGFFEGLGESLEDWLRESGYYRQGPIYFA